MELGIIILLAMVIIVMTSNNIKIKDKKSSKADKDNFDYSKGYKQRWLLSYNEKDAFKEIKDLTDEMGLYLFTKVRLFDLIEPKDKVERRQAHIYKIQAKHVDFVICNEKLVARLIIELDDSSHDQASRIERDKFVDAALTSCGYKVIHIRAVKKDMLRKELEDIFKPINMTI